MILYSRIAKFKRFITGKIKTMNDSRRKALLLLGELNNDDLNWILQKSRKQSVAAGTILIKREGQINALYFVLSGTFSVLLEEKELAEIGKGEVVGEISFIDRRPPLATVKAIKNSTVLAIPHLQLKLKLEQDISFSSRFYYGILLGLTDRMRGTVERLGYDADINELYTEQQQHDLSIVAAEHLELAQAKFNWLIAGSR